MIITFWKIIQHEVIISELSNTFTKLIPNVTSLLGNVTDNMNSFLAKLGAGYLSSH